MAASDFNTLRAALSSLPEHLSEISSHDIVRAPLQLLLGGLLGEGEAGQLALHPWLFHQQWDGCLRLSKNSSDYLYKRLACPDSLLLHLLVKQFDCPPSQLLWELQILVKSGMNRFMGNVIGLSELSDALPPVILSFSGNIGDGTLCIEVPLIYPCCRRFPLFRLLIIAYIFILIKALSW
jgi:hypothetical protein